MSMISSVFDDSEPHRKLFIIENKSMRENEKRKIENETDFSILPPFSSILSPHSHYTQQFDRKKNDTAKELIYILCVEQKRICFNS